MSNIVYKSLKEKIEDLYNKNFAIEIGIYDDNDNLSKESIVPLGNYIYNPMPSNSELEITKHLCSINIK